MEIGKVGGSLVPDNLSHGSGPVRLQHQAAVELNGDRVRRGATRLDDVGGLPDELRRDAGDGIRTRNCCSDTSASRWECG